MVAWNISAKGVTGSNGKKRKGKTIIRIWELVVSARNLNAPPPVRRGKADFLKYKLNGEQKPNVAKSIKMLKT